MDTRVVEIAISLAFIFALTSLLVSALQEAYSSFSGMRGQVLRKAIESFVGDDPAFAQALLDHPLLVSLSPQPQAEQAARRPSYANADTVVAALIGHLVDLHANGRRPDTPQELLELLHSRLGGAPDGTGGLAGADAVGPNALFLRGLSALAMGAGHDWPAFQSRLAAWYDSVGERSTGWFKRKTQVGVFTLGLIVAALANINPIVITARLWTDAPLRQAMTSAATEASKAYAAAQAASRPVGALTSGETAATNRWKAVCTLANGDKPDDKVVQLCATLQDLGSLQQMGLPIGWSPPVWPRVFAAQGLPEQLDRFVVAPLGWLLMGLACTLGAPFWFDALGRLVRLRGSGGQTAGAAPGSGAGAAEAGTAPSAIAGKGMLAPPATPEPAAPPAPAHEHDDDCAVAGAGQATADDQLPPARGGVAA